MLTDTRFHRGRDAQGLMHPREVIVHMEQSQHSDMVLDLLAEGIRKPGEAAHIHPHVEVLTLHIAGADVVVIGLSDDVYALGTKTLRRAVASVRNRTFPLAAPGMSSPWDSWPGLGFTV
jgi:hypothetical protein